MDYADASTEADQKSAGESLVASIKNHIRELAKKDYARLYSESIDSVVMFVPGEHFMIATSDRSRNLSLGVTIKSLLRRQIPCSLS